MHMHTQRIDYAYRVCIYGIEHNNDDHNNNNIHLLVISTNLGATPNLTAVYCAYMKQMMLPSTG